MTPETEQSAARAAEGRLGPSFVNQRTYRRRRLMDMARFLPLLGLVLFVIPLFWPVATDSGAVAPQKLSDAFQYIYGVWGGLIGLSLLFGWAVQRWAQHWTAGPGGSADGPDVEPQRRADPVSTD